MREISIKESTGESTKILVMVNYFEYKDQKFATLEVFFFFDIRSTFNPYCSMFHQNSEMTGMEKISTKFQKNEVAL